MPAAPYQPGELVQVVDGEHPPRLARVSAVLPTDSLLADAQWMVSCRWVADGEPIDTPLHCGDDGVGRRVCPAPAGPTEGARTGLDA